MYVFKFKGLYPQICEFTLRKVNVLTFLLMKKLILEVKSLNIKEKNGIPLATKP